jgi:heat shock protein beta
VRCRDGHEDGSNARAFRLTARCGLRRTQVPADVTRNAKLLYDTALLESGFMLDDPKAFSEKVFSIVKDSMDIPEDAPLEDIEIEEEEEEEEEAEEEVVEDVEVVEEAIEEAEEAHDEL